MSATTTAVLPVGSTGRRSSGWWALVCAIATETALFAYLLFSYYYTFVQLGASWLPDTHPSLKLALPDTLILLASSGTVYFAERLTRRGARGAATALIGTTFLLGAIFVVVQLFEWHAKPYSITSGNYGSLYFTITGFHMAHVLAGLVLLAFVFVFSLLGYLDARRHVPMMIGSAYWHFVDAIWLIVFFSFYLLPRFW